MSYQRPAKPFSEREPESERDLTTVLFPAIIGAPAHWEIIAIEFVDAGGACQHFWEPRPDLVALAPPALTQFGDHAIRRCRDCHRIEGGSWRGSNYEWGRVGPAIEERLNAYADAGNDRD